MVAEPWGNLVGIRPAKQLHRLLDQGLDYNTTLSRMQSAHGISEEKFSLLWRVAQVERPTVKESSLPHLYSVYIGIPFCPTRCLYCSFPAYSLQELGKLRGRFLDALLYEIEATGKLVRKHDLQPYTVYVGGGTPTSLAPQELHRILEALPGAFPGGWREFTVEAGRPDTVTTENLAVLKQHNVTRIGINPQSMHQRTLDLIGRCHSPQDVAQAVEKARGVGFDVLNMDLIVGLPGEDTEMVRESVTRVLSFAPENVTVHAFSRKRASRFTLQQDMFHLPEAEQAIKMHQTSTELLAGKYHPYYLYRQRNILGGQENVGYCIPGRECLYNIVMMEERHHIFGLGSGATSKIIRPHYTLTNINTPKDPAIYIHRVQELTAKRDVLWKTNLVAESSSSHKGFS